MTAILAQNSPVEGMSKPPLDNEITYSESFSGRTVRVFVLKNGVSHFLGFVRQAHFLQKLFLKTEQVNLESKTIFLREFPAKESDLSAYLFSRADLLKKLQENPEIIDSLPRAHQANFSEYGKRRLISAFVESLLENKEETALESIATGLDPNAHFFRCELDKSITLTLEDMIDHCRGSHDATDEYTYYSSHEGTTTVHHKVTYKFTEWTPLSCTKQLGLIRVESALRKNQASEEVVKAYNSVQEWSTRSTFDTHSGGGGA